MPFKEEVASRGQIRKEIEMNSQSKELKKVYLAFPRAYINQHNEIIIYPRRNTCFRLDDVDDETTLSCKILEWLSREACESFSPTSKKYHFEGICKYFDKRLTQEEMEEIYFRLGNSIRRTLTIKFVQLG